MSCLCIIVNPMLRHALFEHICLLFFKFYPFFHLFTFSPFFFGGVTFVLDGWIIYAVFQNYILGPQKKTIMLLFYAGLFKRNVRGVDI